VPNPQTSHAIEEEMVAYLDGELNAAQMQHVEDRLARDPAYRRQLQRLQRAWECLDQLPRSHVEEQFARSTVELVAVQAERETASQPAAAAQPRRHSTLLIIAVAAAAALVGAIGTSRIRSGVAPESPPPPAAAEPAGGAASGVPGVPESDRTANGLAAEDKPVLRQWVARYLVNSPTARRIHSRLSRLPDHPAPRDELDPARAGPAQRPLRRIFHLMVDPRADAAFRSLVDARALDDLKQRLSAPSRVALNAAGGLNQQQDRVRDWIRAMLLEHVHRPNDARPEIGVSHQELERFFAEDLPPDERVRLMAVPRAEMLQELQRLYRREHGTSRRGPPRGP